MNKVKARVVLTGSCLAYCNACSQPETLVLCSPVTKRINKYFCYFGHVECYVAPLARLVVSTLSHTHHDNAVTAWIPSTV